MAGLDLSALLYPYTSRQGKGEGHKDQDEGETGCQVIDYRMDLDEEKGAIQSRVSNDRVERYFGERARERTLRLCKTSGGTIVGLSLNPKTWIRDDGWSL